MVAVPIATGRTPAELRALARRERDGRVSSRLLALANASDGMSRDEAARAAGMDRQTLRDWVHRYNAGGVEGLRDRPRPGRPCALDEGRQAALKALILRGPKLERDGCVAWRARDLCALVEERFGVRYGESGMLKLLKGLDLSWQKTRPIHPEADPRAQERFKKSGDYSVDVPKGHGILRCDRSPPCPHPILPRRLSTMKTLRSPTSRRHCGLTGRSAPSAALPIASTP